MKELIALAKSRPGKLNFAIGALGSSLHLAGDAFKMQSGVYIVNIPYRGTAPAIQDVLAGQVELMFAAVGNAQAHVRAGKLQARWASPARNACPLSPMCPRSPRCCRATNRARGSACSARAAWTRSWPAASATRPGRRWPVRKCGGASKPKAAVPVGNSPEEFAGFVQSEITRWAKVVKFSGAKPE